LDELQESDQIYGLARVTILLSKIREPQKANATITFMFYTGVHRPDAGHMVGRYRPASGCFKLSCSSNAASRQLSTKLRSTISNNISHRTFTVHPSLAAHSGIRQHAALIGQKDLSKIPCIMEMRWLVPGVIRLGRPHAGTMPHYDLEASSLGSWAGTPPATLEHN
jgi:hypothetical protein